MADDEDSRRSAALRYRSRRFLRTGRILDDDEVAIISERILALSNSQPRTPTRQQIADEIGRAGEDILASEVERFHRRYDEEQERERRAVAPAFERCTAKGGTLRAMLRARMGDASYWSWFSSMHFESFNDGVVRVSVPVKFMKNWITAHYADVLLECCAAEFTGAKRVEVIARH